MNTLFLRIHSLKYESCMKMIRERPRIPLYPFHYLKYSHSIQTSKNQTNIYYTDWCEYESENGTCSTFTYSYRLLLRNGQSHIHIRAFRNSEDESFLNARIYTDYKKNSTCTHMSDIVYKLHKDLKYEVLTVKDAIRYIRLYTDNVLYPNKKQKV
jgi:hypothetical protein